METYSRREQLSAALWNTESGEWKVQREEKEIENTNTGYVSFWKTGKLKVRREDNTQDNIEETIY